MTHKINLILGAVLFICIARLHSQEGIPASFILTDHNGEALTGMLKVKILLNGDAIFRDAQDVYVYGGACNLPIDIDLNEGERGTIKVTYVPSVIPLGKDSEGAEILQSIPLINEKGIGLDSPPEEFIVPERKELFFVLRFGYDDVHIVSSTKTGAEREAAKSSEWSKNTKLNVEAGLDIGFFSASENLELESGESETKTFIDRELSENEDSKTWTVRAPNGRLTLIQTNKPSDK